MHLQLGAHRGPNSCLDEGSWRVDLRSRCPSSQSEPLRSRLSLQPRPLGRSIICSSGSPPLATFRARLPFDHLGPCDLSYLRGSPPLRQHLHLRLFGPKTPPNPRRIFLMPPLTAATKSRPDRPLQHLLPRDNTSSSAASAAARAIAGSHRWPWIGTSFRSDNSVLVAVGFWLLEVFSPRLRSCHRSYWRWEKTRLLGFGAWSWTMSTCAREFWTGRGSFPLTGMPLRRYSAFVPLRCWIESLASLYPRRRLADASRLLSRVLWPARSNTRTFFSLRLPMDAAANVKRRRASDCSASSATFVEPGSVLDQWDAFPWSRFPGFTVSERAGRQTSWVWQRGFDIQARDSPTKRKWVCRPCLQRPKPRARDFSALGTQNIEKHLYKEHRLVDESGKRKPVGGTGLNEKTSSRNIVQMLNLDTSNPKEQAIANAFIPSLWLVSRRPWPSASESTASLLKTLHLIVYPADGALSRLLPGPPDCCHYRAVAYHDRHVLRDKAWCYIPERCGYRFQLCCVRILFGSRAESELTQSPETRTDTTNIVLSNGRTHAYVTCCTTHSLTHYLITPGGNWVNRVTTHNFSLCGLLCWYRHCTSDNTHAAKYPAPRNQARQECTNRKEMWDTAKIPLQFGRLKSE
ncbi:hypothetical protein VFPBJ_11627 [Purpureocillium lilacinum]|uniref:BED-type domain-containing protein n=1 Tax=Purpureocillium lilacinum TaxID=33203 RepID=A0A179F0V6_PURLI|nr:hypothetical protein VFPBJ_11627 [Purpureocillium lilacinum]